LKKLTKLKIAIIGAGRMGERHAQVYSKINDVEIVAICDPISEKAKHLAEIYSCSSFEDISSLVNAEIFDAASICTPHFQHFEDAKILLLNKKHILVEKPLAMSVDDCKEIIELSKTNNVNLMVGQTHRFYPCNVELKKILDADTIGKVKLVTDYSLSPYQINQNSSKAPEWVYQKNSGGVLWDAVHTVDRIRWWFNSNFESVTTHSLGNLRESSDAEEFALVGFTLENGIKGYLYPVGPSWGVYDSQINILGNNGVAFMKYGEELKVGAEKWKYFDFYGKASPPSPEHIFQGFYDELSEFVNSIKQKRMPSISGEDGLAAVKTINAIYQSAKDQRTIKIENS